MGMKGMWPLVKPHLHFASVFQLHQMGASESLLPVFRGTLNLAPGAYY